MLVSYASEDRQLTNSDRVSAVVIPLMVFLVVVYIAGRIYRRRKEKEIARLEALRQEVAVPR